MGLIEMIFTFEACCTTIRSKILKSTLVRVDVGDKVDDVGDKVDVVGDVVVGDVDIGEKESCANRLGIIVSILTFDRSTVGRSAENWTLSKLEFISTAKSVNAAIKDKNVNENRQKINILLDYFIAQVK
ncbi:69_t:CDS:2 [Cetraspora pellucida]|uniref:69_t:CDS:1 n=1 Tax=Cetraspora pellucida TaxID=1433469 RepID=A0A9N8VI68_9GLOM|nr:69_t:CDS:2 [Cetraspora pellucida]